MSYKAEELYSDFHYPKAYLNLLEDWECESFGEWDFFPEQSMEAKIYDLRSKYPERKLIPFAERKRKDSIACFECGKGKKVIIVHPQTLRVQGSDTELDDVWAWMHFAVDEIKADSFGLET